MTDDLSATLQGLIAARARAGRPAPATRIRRDPRPTDSPITRADLEVYAGDTVMARAALDLCPDCDGYGSRFTTAEHGYTVALDCWCVRAAAAARRVCQAGIPRTFADATLDGTAPLPHLHRALDVARAWADGHGPSAALIGAGVGTGKSRVAALCALFACLAGRTVRWGRMAVILDEVRATYRRDAAIGRPEAIRSYTAPDVLVIDEIDATTEHGSGILADIVEARYQRDAATLITSNLGGDGLLAALGARVVDRLGEMMGSPIVVEGPSYRATRRRERLAREGGL